jgi:hypothetical protein
MDLRIFGRVLWRFKYMVLVGFVVAIALAFMSMVRVSKDGKIAYRQGETWVSYSQLFVTQQGFPWGKLAVSQTSDPGRFSSLALIYAQWAPSDLVRQIMLRSGPIHGKIEAAAVTTSPTSNDALPIVQIAGYGDSLLHSLQITQRATAALVKYVGMQQAANGIPDSNRVLLQQIQVASKSKLVSGRSKTLPIVVFLAVMSAIVALAFARENWKPRVRVAVSKRDDPVGNEAGPAANPLSA